MRVEDALPDHARSLLSKPLRQADIDEWVLGLGRPVGFDVLAGASGPSRALLNEAGECICLWGNEGGLVWLIATQEAERRARAIHRLWRTEVALLHDGWPHLRAFSHHRNALHHAWLRAIGFEQHHAVSLPPFGAQFILFTRSKETP